MLADTAVTLEQGTSGAVVTEVVKKMLKVKYSVTYVHVLVIQLHSLDPEMSLQVIGKILSNLRTVLE